MAVSVTNALVIQPFQVMVVKVEKRKQYITTLFLGTILLLFISSVLIIIVFQIFIKASVFRLNPVEMICFITGFLINDFFRKLFLGLSRIKEVLIMDILFLILVILVFTLYKICLSQVLLIIGLCNWIATLPGFLFMIKNYEKPILWSMFAKEHLKEGKWLLSVAVLQWSSSNFFILVAGVYLGIEALGALRLVQSFFGIINIGLQTIENYFLPKIALLYHQNKETAKEYLFRLSSLGALVFGVLTCVLFIFSNQTIVLVGGVKYQHYGYVIKMVAVLYFFIFLGYPVRILVRILMLNKIFFMGYLLSFLTSLASFHFLLKYSGLCGAVTGLMINQIIMILYWRYQLYKKQFQLWK
ncbi:hypothetical protein [Flavobacterium sp.]|uniref:lipopolysaccharide biosynthesis protein n=1 Tax=Flavobacterium sp. TaxID=239 RepID=UPI0025B97A77|nr:hypothetical protein [Flavobacterium sp.]